MSRQKTRQRNEEGEGRRKRKRRGKGGGGWRNHNTQFLDYLQIYNNKDSTVLAKEQKYRPLKQNREPRNRPIQIVTDL